MSFTDELKRNANTTYTDNGALAKSTSGDALVDLFAMAGAARDMNFETLYGLWKRARVDYPTEADNFVLYIRDIRNGGCGERKIGRRFLKELAMVEPEKVTRNLQKIADAGRWDDLYELIGTPVEQAMWNCMSEQLKKDVIGVIKNEPISILAKWLKSVNASSAQTRKLGKMTAIHFGLTEKEYRKTLAKLRNHLDVVERKMSAGRWNEINFEKVPSVALNRYIKCYNNRCQEAFAEYKLAVQKGEAKINASTLYPYDIMQKILNGEANAGGWYDINVDHALVDSILEEQWKALPNYLNEDMNVLVVADTSGSMFSPNWQPIATSIGLAMYFAERNTGAYHNMFMTFSSSPQVIQLEDNMDFVTKINKIGNAPWGGSTNLDKTYEMIYNMASTSGEAPAAICVISDMQINAWARQGEDYAKTITEKWENKFRAIGLRCPKFVYWNVNATRPTFHSGANTAYLSGYGIGPFKNLNTLLECSALEGVLKILNLPEFTLE
jgi:hypothetical protein